MADTLLLRQALEETEARLAAAVREAEEAGSELGASRCGVSGMETELEAITGRCEREKREERGRDEFFLGVWVVGDGLA